MFNKYIVALIISLFANFHVGLNEALALDVPNFPSCTNISAPLKVSYDNGTHGIAGRTEIYTGSDKVYQISPETLTQCFCATNGAGVQTNWWEAASLTENQIQVFKNEGWIYIPNGALWGLKETAYLAKNADFSCKNGTSGGSSSSSNSGQGSILDGISTSVGNVLGLAFTGNIMTIIELILAGMILIAGGFIFKRKPSKKPRSR